ncbi:MAG: peptide chain release factor N(5)-glutamine methyltransferase [Anaerolineae bacterium]|nr:peptide chain release factor N(5)-glutamine methyltransferase [Anaerolineae bacterium]
MPTIGEALATARQRLTPTSETALLDARLLLSFVIDQPTAWLYAHSDSPLTSEQTETFSHLIDQRSIGMPIAYLTGTRGFYHWDFVVTPDVLIPRPETEHLIEAAQTWLKNRQGEKLNIVDVGTGSGIIAVSLALLFPQVSVTAIDVSPAALEIAKLNAGRLGAENIEFRHGNLLNSLPSDFQVDLIAANLPYIDHDEMLTLEVAKWEPHLALDGGIGGLDLIRDLLHQAPVHLKPGGLILLEIGADQGEATQQLALEVFPNAVVKIQQDLAGLDRIVSVQTLE